jgi:hypothetical protein
MKKNVNRIVPVVLAATLVASNISVVSATEASDDSAVAVDSNDEVTSDSAVEVSTDDDSVNVVSVAKDSTASDDTVALEAYASTDIVYGDWNGDGKFDEADLTAIQAWLADDSNTVLKKEDNEARFYAMDVTGQLTSETTVASMYGYLQKGTVKADYGWLQAKLHNGRLMPCDVGEAYRWGDANGDGKVQNDDAAYTLDITLDKSLQNEHNLLACDMDDNGSITANDSSCILKYLLVGYEVSPLFYIEPVNPTTEYAPGATLEDITIKRTYEDGSTLTNKVSELNAIVSVDGETAENYVLTEGTHTVKVQYSEAYDSETITKSTTYDVTVEKKITRLSVTEKQEINYIEGQKLDRSNYIVTAYYNTGDTAIVSGYTTDKDNMKLKTTDTEVTFSYDGLTAKADIDVRAKKMTGIYISEEPTKVDYIEGNTFDKTGLEVTAEYDNGDTEVVDDYTVPTDKLELGDTSVTVSYNGFTAEQPITVKAKSMTGIKITKPADKTEYIEGNTFDKTGLEVTAEYDNGDTEVVDDYTVPTDKLVLGDTSATVSYNGFTAEQPITVNAKSMTGITITKPADKTEYIEGNTFDKTGLEVTAEYDNGDTEVVDDYTVPTDKLALGDKTVTVSYNGFTAEQPITVNAKSMTGITITKPADKTEYIEGNTFDKTGLEVTAEYDNGDTEVVDDYTVPTDKLALGDISATVSYNGFTAEQPITVNAKSMTGITITKPADKTEYTEGETFDNSGMEVEAKYDNGDTEIVSDYDYDKEPLTVGQTFVKIIVGSFQAEQSVIVSATTTESTTESTSETTTESTTESTTETTTESTTESTSETTTESTTESISETTTESTTESTTETTTESTTESTTETTTESTTESTTEATTESTTKSSTSNESSSHNSSGHTSGHSSNKASVGGDSSSKSKNKTSGASSDNADVNSSDNTDSTNGLNDISDINNSDDWFSDISSSYARDYINSLARKGILNGYADNTYRPTASTKRGDFAIVISKLMNYSGIASLDFSDVPAMSYYANYIALTTKNDSMIGYGDGTFKPEKTLSREEMFVIIAKISGADISNADTSVLNSFADGNKVADWAKPYAAALVKSGIVNGDNDSLRPQDNITRAEMAVLIAQIVG